ncbi:MAG: hypothetical protein R6U32_06185 [Candidatus Woesearchaeota archaeon]
MKYDCKNIDGRMIPKIIESKKAEGPGAPNYAIYFIISGVIIALFAVFLVIATSAYHVETTSILGGLQSTVAEFRLLNSPECFVHQDDDTERIYSHIIDMEKFDEERLEGCMGEGSPVCIKVDLEYDDEATSLETPNYKNPEEIKVSRWPVVVKEDDELKRGEMRISTSKKCLS